MEQQAGNSPMLDKITGLQGHPVVEATMLGTTVGTFGGLLPSLAALLPIVWYSIQILESRTAKRLRAWLCAWFVRRS